jgi:hypothetical protein
MLVALNGIQPASPSAVRQWVRPGTVVLHNASQTDHPGRELDVDVRELVTEKERAVGLGHIYDFTDFVLEFFGVLGLFVEVLGL